MLTRDILDMWSDALRSGKYKQSQEGVLLDGRGRFCCLGVLGAVCGLDPDVLRGSPFLGGEVITDATQQMFAGLNDDDTEYHEDGTYTDTDPLRSPRSPTSSTRWSWRSFDARPHQEA